MTDLQTYSIRAFGLLLLFNLSCSRSGDTNRTIERIPTLEMTTDLIIGSEDQPLEHQLGRPIAVRTDEEGAIYIADRASKQIKVFDKEGRYQKSLGGRGRGPGEFQDMEFMELTPEGDLVLMDRGRLHYMIISTDGEEKGTFPYQLSHQFWPLDIAYVDEQILGLFPDDQHLPDDVATEELFEKSYLFCVYSSDFQDHRYSFMPFSRLGIEDEFVYSYTSWHTGSFTVDQDRDQLVYSPGTYTGTLFFFQKQENGQWTYVTSFEGVPPFGEVFQRYATEQEFNGAKGKTIPGASKLYARDVFMGRLLSMDAGTFYLNDGHLVQFFAEWKEGEKIGSDSQHLLDLSVQVFNENLELQYQSYLFSIQRNTIVEGPLIEWKDEQDRFYLLNPGNDDLFATVPIVRRFELELPE